MATRTLKKTAWDRVRLARDPGRPHVRDFIAGKGCVEDGSASKRVVDLIEEITEGKQA